MPSLNIQSITQSCTTNSDGFIFKIALEKALSTGEKLNLDFSNIGVVSTSFLNSSFGDLFDQYGIEKFRGKVAMSHCRVEIVNMVKKYFTDYEQYAS